MIPLDTEILLKWLYLRQQLNKNHCKSTFTSHAVAAVDNYLFTAKIFKGVSKTREEAQNLLSAMPLYNYRKSQIILLLP